MAKFMGRPIFRRGGQGSTAPSLPPQANGGPPRPLKGPMMPIRPSSRLVTRGNQLGASYETAQKVVGQHAHGMVHSPTPEMREWHKSQWAEAQRTLNGLGQSITSNVEEMNQQTGRGR